MTTLRVCLLARHRGERSDTLSVARGRRETLRYAQGDSMPTSLWLSSVVEVHIAAKIKQAINPLLEDKPLAK